MVWQKDFPASSANLGPGFDSIGIAVDRYLTVTACPAERWQVDFETDFMADLPQDESNLVVAVALETAARYGKTLAPLHLTMKSQIPLTHGMGSSASAIVAGIELANDFADLGLSTFDKVRLASAKEGHPDNVAPAVFGGATVAWVEADGTPRAAPMPVDGTLPVSLLVPPSTTRLSTEEARKVLPDSVPRADALFNTSRAAVLMLALAGRPDLLLTGTEDRLHQEYRRSVLPSSMAVMDSLRRQGYPAVISGAGPTVLVLADVAQQTRFTLERHGWTVLRPGIDTRGAVLTSVAS